MNTFSIKQLLPFLFFLLISQGFYGKSPEVAQKDSVLQREMFLEAEYSPTIRDANKVNILPEVEDPKPVKARISYAPWAITTTPVPETILPEAQHFGTEEMLYDKKGYLTFGGGYPLNLRAAAGYEILNTETDFFRISLSHLSTHGKVAYGLSEDDEKEKAKLNDNLFNAFYKHRFDNLDLYAGVTYGYTGYNYYGYGFSMEIPDKMQVFQLINPSAGIESTHDRSLQYEAELDYRYSTKKYTYTIEDNGLKESAIFTRVNVSNHWDSFRLGLAVDMHSLFYSGLNSDERPGGYSNFGVTPYFWYQDEDNRLKAKIGIRTDISTKGDHKIVVTPDVLLEYDLYNGTWLYATATGGKNINSQAAIARENRYLNPDIRLMDSRTLVDASLGLRTSALEKWLFNVYGRYKKTKEEHFYYRTDLSGNHSFFNSFGAGYYDKADLIQVGGKVAFNHQDMIGVSVEAAKNFWDTKFSHPYYSETITKPVNLPDIELKILLEATILSQLKANIGFDWLNGRYGLETWSRETKMDDLQNLHIGANYIMNRSISLSVQLNNLLNKKYDVWYSYPEQGISVMAGFTLLF